MPISRRRDQRIRAGPGGPQPCCRRRFPRRRRGPRGRRGLLRAPTVAPGRQESDELDGAQRGARARAGQGPHLLRRRHARALSGFAAQGRAAEARHAFEALKRHKAKELTRERRAVEAALGESAVASAARGRVRAGEARVCSRRSSTVTARSLNRGRCRDGRDDARHRRGRRRGALGALLPQPRRPAAKAPRARARAQLFLLFVILLPCSQRRWTMRPTSPSRVRPRDTHERHVEAHGRDEPGMGRDRELATGFILVQWAVQHGTLSLVQERATHAPRRGYMRSSVLDEFSSGLHHLVP